MYNKYSRLTEIHRQQYQDRLLSGPLGLLDLGHMAPVGVKHKDLGGEVLR
jgi:hypothetical protein